MLAILRTQLADGNYIFSVLLVGGRRWFHFLPLYQHFCHADYDLIPRNEATRNFWPGITFGICLDITMGGWEIELKQFSSATKHF